MYQFAPIKIDKNISPPMSTRPSRPTSAISPRPTSVSPTRKFNFSLAPTPSRPTTADFNLRQITTTASSSRQHSRQSSFSLSPQEQTELEQDLRTSLTNHRVSLHHRHQPPIKIQQMKIDYSTALIGVTKSLGKFGIEYAKGGIPCRVSHEGRNKNGNGLKWNIDLSMLESFNPLAITFFIGLEETSHPYTFLVKEGIKDILASTGARRKIIPILPNLINPIRRGLSSVKRENVVVTLNAMRMLSRLCGKEFIPCFAKILPVVQSKAIYGDSDVMNTLNAIEMVIRRDLEGYDQSIVARLIKLYVPTYVAVGS